MSANNTEHIYCLILAGGKGRRLWPESNIEIPKQFIDFFGTGRTQLQETYDRFKAFLPIERILISTNINYYDIVKEQLPEVPDENILSEPIWRNTAPSIVWGAHRVRQRDSEAVIITAPSDHHVIHHDIFQLNVKQGAEFAAANDVILTMGVPPTRPEPGYGYIQFEHQLADNVFSTRAFIEKPDRDFAQMFIDSGEFYWNTGMFISKAKTILTSIKDLFPALYRHIISLNHNTSTEEEKAYVMEHFSRYPNISMEKGVIEKVQNVCVMKCHFGWADLGTWHGIYEAKHAGPRDNVILDSDVILDNAEGNIIKVPHGHLAVINGLKDFIVVEKGDTLLICPREDSSALIRKYAAEVEIR